MDMLHVVIDTNVLVSAFMSNNGNPFKIVHLIPDRKIIPCYNEYILTEYTEVLSRKRFGFPQHQINALINNIKKYGKAYNPPKSTIPLPDEKDRAFYDVAVESQAIIITGNIQHYPNIPFAMLPAVFLAKIINDYSS